LADAAALNEAGYQFTNGWFDAHARGVWDQLIPSVNPTRILEVGSYEGASTVYLISLLGPNHGLEVHCVDTWEGGIEHAGVDMSAVEHRFHHNVGMASAAVANPVDVIKHKGFSDAGLARLLAEGKAGYFDFVYIDGSHQAPDVLCDAVLAFRLLRVGGVMAFDDYLWADRTPRDILTSP
jgi:predicted O-methyltransferase YrrM